MNILYINHYAGSPEHGMEFRPYYMAQAWQDAGHCVRMVAAAYSHVRAKQPQQNDGQSLTQKTTEIIGGIEYVWYPAPAYDGNGIGRIKNIFTFLSRLWLDAKNIAAEFKPDVVIASSTYPMDIWVAKRIARLAGAKLIYEVHDLWPLSPIELGGMSPKHPFILLCQAAENYAYKHADKIVSMLPKVHEHMAAHGLDLSKLHIIPNGIVEKDWLPENHQTLSNETLKQLMDDQHRQGKIVVGYAGAHGKSNALEYLLDAAKHLEQEPITFVLVGSGLEKARLQTKATNEKIHNVVFFEPIPKTQIPSLLAVLDIAYIGWHITPIYRFGISPNKLMDYMMAGKAILHSVEAANDPVAENECGISVPPENPVAIAKGILKLAALSDEERAVMGARGRAFILQNQTYRVLAQKFLEVMQS